MAKFGFDVSDVEISAAPVSYDPIPEGEYTLKAVEAEEKTTSKGDGSYIKVKFEVVKGDYSGRLLWQNFNHNNPSEKAQSIGRRDFRSQSRTPLAFAQRLASRFPRPSIL